MAGFPWEVVLLLAVVGVTMTLIVRDYLRGPKRYATVKELLQTEQKLQAIWEKRFQLHRSEVIDLIRPSGK